jgi:hypothetical protein
VGNCEPVAGFILYLKFAFFFIQSKIALLLPV